MRFSTPTPNTETAMNDAKMSNHTTPCRHTIEAEGEGFRIWFRPRYIEHQKCGLFKSIEKARESLWVVPPAITRYYPDAIEEYGSEENEPETIDLPVGLTWYEELGGQNTGWVCEVNGPGWWHVEELNLA